MLFLCFRVEDLWNYNIYWQTSINPYLASVIQPKNKLLTWIYVWEKIIRKKSHRLNMWKISAFYNTFPQFWALFQDSIVISFQDKPRRSQHGAKKSRRSSSFLDMCQFFLTFFSHASKSDRSFLLYKGSTPFVALKTEFRQIFVSRIFRRGKTLRAKGAFPRSSEEEGRGKRG